MSLFVPPICYFVQYLKKLLENSLDGLINGKFISWISIMMYNSLLQNFFKHIKKIKKNVRPYITIHRILKYHISLYACKITFFITLKEDIKSTFYDNPIKCRSQQ